MKKLLVPMILLCFSSILFPQTKPVEGIIKGENDSTLTSVKIISIPSNTKVNADQEGKFSFLMPVRDRNLIINHFDHYSDTVNAILFENHSKYNLTKIIPEIDITDSSYLLSLIRDTLTSLKANLHFKYYSLFNPDFQTYPSMSSLLYNNELVSLLASIDGISTLSYRSISVKEMDILFDGIKINNLGSSVFYLDQFSKDELLGIGFVPMGYYQSMPTFGTFNIFPKIDYGINASYRQNITNNNINNYSGYGSLGFKYATINGSYGKKNIKKLYSENDSLMITSLNEHSSINMGFRTNKKLEFRIMGFQNLILHQNNKLEDSLNVSYKNLITKMYHKQKDNGLMSLYSLYQSRKSNENFGIIDLDKEDENIEMGFGFEKGFEEIVFSINAKSNFIFSDWKLDTLDISTVRSNSNFSGSFAIEKPTQDKRIQLKNISLIFNRQHTKDTQINSNNFIISDTPDSSFENWEQAGSMFNIAFISNVFNEEFILKGSIGSSYTIPTISDRILNTLISDVSSNPVLSEENKSLFEFGLKKEFSKYSEQIPNSFSLKVFQYLFNNKIKYIYSIGSPIKIPRNIGEAYINGSDFEFNILSKTKKYQLSSYLSVYNKSNSLAFQLQPDWIFKNKFSAFYQKFRYSIIHKIESEMQITILTRNGALYPKIIPPRNNIDFSFSVNIKYKYLKGLVEFSGQNMIKEIFQLDDLYLFEPNYLISIKFNL